MDHHLDAPSPPHLSDADLDAWLDGSADPQRARIVGHLAQCAGCTSRLTARLTERAHDPGVLASFRTRGRAAGPMSHRPARLQRVWVAVAASVLLVVAAGLGLRLVESRQATPPADASTIRGDQILLVAPASTGPVPERFAWRSPVTAAEFVLEVFDDRGRQVFTAHTPDEALTSPPSLRQTLAAGGRFAWQVAARAADGTVLLTSPRQSFTVAR